MHLSEAERFAWARPLQKNSTTILGMAPAIGSWVAAKGLHAAPTPPDHGDHARLLSLRLSMHSMCRFLIHSIVGDHVLRDHQVELQSIQCELHLGDAHCRLDCMIVSFVGNVSLNDSGGLGNLKGESSLRISVCVPRFLGAHSPISFC